MELQHTSDPTVKVTELTKRYGDELAVDSISFEVQPGETVGFLGPNGAGKSTTMQILCGLMPASSGFASICGHSIALDPLKIKKDIAFLPENNPLPGDMRVIEYLKLRARLKDIPKKEQKERINSALEACELVRSCERKMIRTLSKGFRQRVGIADCLLGKPSILILDEPTIGLDPHQILNIRTILKSLKGKLSVILSSHILPEIEPICDRFIIINKGHIIAQGTKSQLQTEFQVPNQYTLNTNAPDQAVRETLKNCISDANIESSTPGLYTIHSCEPENKTAQIIDKLSKINGYTIFELNRKEASLEDIFINATIPAWKNKTHSTHAA